MKLMAFTLGLLFAFPVQATEHDFKVAIGAWLADDDEIALPILAKLSSQGNVKAQLLLGRISQGPYSPYVQNLPKKERNALLRAPGGLSGRSWLKVTAADGNELASAFVQASAPPFNMENISILLNNGEDATAALTLTRSLNYRGIKGVPSDLKVEADVLYAVHLAQFVAGERKIDKYWRVGDGSLRFVELIGMNAWLNRRPIDETALSVSLHLFPGKFWNTNPHQTGIFLESIASDSRPANRLLRFCRKICASQLMNCIGDTVGLANGYDQIWKFGSPLQSVIDERTFLKSPRFHADFSRRLALKINGMPKEAIKYWRQKSCVAANILRATE